MSITRLGLDGGVARGLEDTSPVVAAIGLVTASSGVVQPVSYPAPPGPDAITRMGLDGTVDAAAPDPDTAPVTAEINQVVAAAGEPQPVIDPNPVSFEVGQVSAINGQALAVTAGLSPVITLVSSIRGSDVVTESGTLTILVNNSAGITSVTVNGVACTTIQIITGTEINCQVPRGTGAAYGSSVDVVVSNGIPSTGYAATLEPPQGMLYTSFTVGYAGLDPDSPYAGDPAFSAIDVGTVSIYDSITTPDSHSVVMDGAGQYTLGGLPVTQQQQFDYYFYDPTDQTVSTTIEQITIEPGIVEAVIGQVIGTAGEPQSVTSLVVVTQEIGLVTGGVGEVQSVLDGSTVFGSIGQVIGSAGEPQSVTGGPQQIVAIGQVVAGAGEVQPVIDGSTPTQEIGQVIGTAGTVFPVIDSGAVVGIIGQVLGGAGEPQPVSYPADLNSIQAQLDALQDSVDSLTALTAAQSAVLAAQSVLLSELHIRFDLDASVVNTYTNNGDEISNSQFTLTKVKSGSTFDIERS